MLLRSSNKPKVAAEKKLIKLEKEDDEPLLKRQTKVEKKSLKKKAVKAEEEEERPSKKLKTAVKKEKESTDKETDKKTDKKTLISLLQQRYVAVYKLLSDE